MPSRVAAAVGTSIQASHATWVIGSGASCSHERLAPRPSYHRSEGYARSANPFASPSSLAGVRATVPVRALATGTLGTLFHTPPRWSAASQPSAVTTPSHVLLTYASKLGHGSGPLPSSVPSTARPTSISTWPVDRESRTGDIVGCMSPRTPSRGA